MEHYMIAWRYEISPLVLKKYFSPLKEKFRISALPCNILYVWKCSYLVPCDLLCESISHHLTQDFFFTLCLSCQLGTSMTKPSNVVLWLPIKQICYIVSLGKHFFAIDSTYACLRRPSKFHFHQALYWNNIVKLLSFA